MPGGHLSLKLCPSYLLLWMTGSWGASSLSGTQKTAVLSIISFSDHIASSHQPCMCRIVVISQVWKLLWAIRFHHLNRVPRHRPEPDTQRIQHKYSPLYGI